MTAAIQRLFESLPPQGSIDELGVVIERIRDVYDVDHVVYHATCLGRSVTLQSEGQGLGRLSHGSGLWYRDPSALVTSSYPVGWVEHYVNEDYKKIDPVVESATSSFLPYDWKALRWDTKRKQRIISEGVDAGLGNQGYTVPIRGPDGQFALFSINKKCDDSIWERFIEEKKGDLLVVAHFYHQKVLEIEKAFGPPPVTRLSDRERDVLTSIAAGRSRGQVAEKLNISENTVRVYLDSARHKLGALNITHAVAISVQKGLINV